MQITKTRRKRLLLKQKLIGVSILALCIAIIMLASKGTTPEEKDAGIVVFLMPLSLYIIFTKKIVIS